MKETWAQDPTSVAAVRLLRLVPRQNIFRLIDTTAFLTLVAKELLTCI